MKYEWNMNMKLNRKKLTVSKQNWFCRILNESYWIETFQMRVYMKHLIPTKTLVLANIAIDLLSLFHILPFPPV